MINKRDVVCFMLGMALCASISCLVANYLIDDQLNLLRKQIQEVKTKLGLEKTPQSKLAPVKMPGAPADLLSRTFDAQEVIADQPLLRQTLKLCVECHTPASGPNQALFRFIGSPVGDPLP